MSIVEYETVTTNNLNSNEPTKFGIGFCYFDPVSETLKEFTETVKIPILPYEESVRRYYLVKDSNSIIANIVTVTIKSNSEDYIIKNLCQNKVDETPFENIPNNNSNIVFLSDYPNGIVPIDVYIKSETYSLNTVILEIKLEV